MNLVLCLLLTDRLDVAGLGLATAVSATVSAIVLLIPTIRRYPQALDKTFWSGVLRMVVATAVMSGAVYAVYRLLSGWLSDGLVGRVLVLGIPTAVGIGVYFLMALALRLPEMDLVRRRSRKK